MIGRIRPGQRQFKSTSICNQYYSGVTYMNATRRITINSTSDIVSASVKGREIARQLGFSATDQSRISLVISELARILSWGTSVPGEIVMCDKCQSGHRGLEIACLVDLDKLPEGQHNQLARKSSILWRNLARIRRLADESRVEEQNEQQACVMLTKWMS
jgi:hypothetical protein